MNSDKIVYSSKEEFEIFEKQSVYFEELRNKHNYWGGNAIKEMIDFCVRNKLESIKRSLTRLLLGNNFIKPGENDKKGNS